MDRYLLIAATLCFFLAVLRTLLELRADIFRPARFNFILIATGFVLQTGFLWIRGRAVGRCPLTNLFEVINAVTECFANTHHHRCRGFQAQPVRLAVNPDPVVAVAL